MTGFCHMDTGDWLQHLEIMVWLWCCDRSTRVDSARGRDLRLSAVRRGILFGGMLSCRRQPAVVVGASSSVFIAETYTFCRKYVETI